MAQLGRKRDCVFLANRSKTLETRKYFVKCYLWRQPSPNCFEEDFPGFRSNVKGFQDLWLVDGPLEAVVGGGIL